ncbi:hypothetical protein [Flavobacterium crassostreae]|uniref:Internalin n=1 Tax=Flavobacterium crassostreae TaxID=1763534 RepID=A0A1B9E8V3_9FLAO|nr:hypothetical protein [Flavobacterium crassostreae]OCB78387.1 hypothetical protein LPBF_02345 [Flavobacterium crassostreae]
MKKLFFLALATQLVACTTDNKETTVSAVALEKENTSKPNPGPEDYNSAEFLRFSQTNTTARTAAYVATAIPDAALRNKLLTLGAAVDNSSTTDNIVLIDNTRGGLNLDSSGISDLTGIQAYTSLVQLSVAGNNLSSIAISGLPNLAYFDCRYNATLTSVNLSVHTKLAQIWCNNNPSLTTLILPTATTTLWGLWCYSANLTNLNLNGNTNLNSLFCQSNKLTNSFFSSLKYYTNLKGVNLSANKMTVLDLHLNTQLTSFWCYSNSLLTDINIRNGFNSNIVNQDFRYNTKAPLIHVDAAFLPNANTLWPKRGTSIYTAN